MWEQEGIIKRYSNNPILLPREEHGWESKLVYNCAAARIGGTVYLIYRAMGEDHVSRFGLAYSRDGIGFQRLAYPVLLPKAEYERPHASTMRRERERGGVEDPRAVIIGSYLYLIYTAYHKKCHIAMARVGIDTFQNLVRRSKRDNNKDLSREWNNSWERIGLIFPHLFEMPEYFSRNSVIMGLRDDLFLLFYRINKGDILVSLSSHPEGPWKERGVTFLTRRFEWEQERIGISTPPIVVDRAQNKILIFYHGVEEKRIIKKLIKVYHLGAFFLSAHVDGGTLNLKIERVTKPLLEPLKNYETDSQWLLPSHVQAVFSCGAVPAGNNEILVYYGSGDSHISLGKVSIEDLEKEQILVEHREIDMKLFSAHN